MSTFRFLHAADIHLDSPLRGLERYDDAPVEAVRAAPREAFENLVQLAIDLEVAFVLLAGDLYDGNWKDYQTGIFFVHQMQRLERAEIPVFLVSGNHDAESQITRKLSLPANVTHFSSRRAQTKLLPELGVAIHGQSFKGRAVPDDLSAGYPQAESGRFEIGLLHTSLDGREGHANYAPCTLEGLRSKGYGYWALGHVHKREVVAEDPWVVFPGNVQGRHARETGAKGCTVVSVDNGRVTAVEAHALDVVRWEHLEIDLGAVEADTGPAAIDRAVEVISTASAAADGRLLAARITFTGACAAHANLSAQPDRWEIELRNAVGALPGAGVWIERVQFATTRLLRLEDELERQDALGDLLRWVSELGESSADLSGLGGLFGDLKKKLPGALKTGEDAVDPTDPDRLRAHLPAVRDLLLARLLDVEARTAEEDPGRDLHQNQDRNPDRGARP